jgi:hypothetical protein
MLNRASRDGAKTRTERAGAPAFSAVVEVLSYDEWRIHTSTAAAVDALLAGGRPPTQLRRFDADGRMVCRFKQAIGPQCFSDKVGGAAAAGPSALRSDRRADQAIGVIDRRANEIDR